MTRKDFLTLGVVIIIASLIFVFPKNKPAVTTGFPETIQRVLPSVVHIGNKIQGWQGSGVVITEDLILTARHVVENGDDFTITLNDGTWVKSSKAISSKKYDLGFIKLDSPMLKPAEFGSIKKCRLGERVFVIGSQFGISHFNSVTLGIISAIQRDWGESWGWQVTFQIDAGANPGSSGGPVFNMNGKIIGIVVGSPTRIFAGVVYVVPINLITDLDIINLMFLQDEYYFEKALEYFEPETKYTN